MSMSSALSRMQNVEAIVEDNGAGMTIRWTATTAKRPWFAVVGSQCCHTSPKTRGGEDHGRVACHPRVQEVALCPRQESFAGDQPLFKLTGENMAGCPRVRSDTV